MSEIKGQLLGILLVIAIFAAVSAGLISAFEDAATEVGSNITGAIVTPQG